MTACFGGSQRHLPIPCCPVLFTRMSVRCILNTFMCVLCSFIYMLRLRSCLSRITDEFWKQDQAQELTWHVTWQSSCNTEESDTFLACLSCIAAEQEQRKMTVIYLFVYLFKVIIFFFLYPWGKPWRDSVYFSLRCGGLWWQSSHFLPISTSAAAHLECATGLICLRGMSVARAVWAFPARNTPRSCWICHSSHWQTVQMVGP